MNGGSVYPGWHGSLELLIDVKSKAGPTYAALDHVLRGHPGLITSFTGDQTHRGAVTAVVTGHRRGRPWRPSPCGTPATTGGSVT